MLNFSSSVCRECFSYRCFETERRYRRDPDCPAKFIVPSYLLSPSFSPLPWYRARRSISFSFFFAYPVSTHKLCIGLRDRL